MKNKISYKVYQFFFLSLKIMNIIWFLQKQIMFENINMELLGIKNSNYTT